MTPPVDRQDAPLIAEEREMLEGWLDYHRATLVKKCEGLDAAHLRERSCPPSPLSLLGLVRHMTEVDRSWFRRRAGGEDIGFLFDYDRDEDADFNDIDDAEPDAAVAAFWAEIETCTAAAAGLGLDHTFVRRGETFSLRWVYVHMIEEYARHNGHADLIRERIDGTTGD